MRLLRSMSAIAILFGVTGCFSYQKMGSLRSIEVSQNLLSRPSLIMSVQEHRPMRKQRVQHARWLHGLPMGQQLKIAHEQQPILHNSHFSPSTASHEFLDQSEFLPANPLDGPVVPYEGTDQSMNTPPAPLEDHLPPDLNLETQQPVPDPIEITPPPLSTPVPLSRRDSSFVQVKEEHTSEPTWPTIQLNLDAE